MRKLILSLALVGIATVAFGQKKVVRSAERNLNRGNLQEAYTEVQAALQDAETGDQSDTHLLKGKIEAKMFAADSSNTEETLSLGRTALGSFQKTMELENQDSSSKVGKEVYQPFMDGVPDNLQAQGVMFLKQASLNKAIDRYDDEDMELAAGFFGLAADIDPADTSLVFNAGYTANMVGNFEDAKKYLTKLLEVPEYNKLNAYYFLIQIASGEDKDQEEAYRLVNEAREAYPTDKALAEFEIQLLLQLNKMDEAMASIKTALESDPDNTAIRLRYGYLKEQSGDLKGALEEYKRTVETDPNFFEGNYYAGAVYLDNAREIINEVNNLDDKEWEAKSDTMLAEADKLYEEAVPYFTKASQLQPENTEILRILFQVHTRLKDEAKAKEYDQKLQQLVGPDWQNQDF